MSKEQNMISIFRDRGIIKSLATIIKNLFLDRKLVALHSRKVSRVFHEQFRAYPRLGYWPDIHCPKSFNEKVLNRMLMGRNELYTVATDKLASREYVRNIVGEDILPDIYYVSDNPETIPFESLPESYVIKSTFGSGKLLLVDETTTVDKAQLIDECKGFLSENHYLEKAIIGGHYNFDYSNITPKIMIEEYLTGKHQEIPRDYKFYVFHGKVEYVHVDISRFSERSMRFFDREWNPQEFRKGGNMLGPVIDKPPQYDRMVEIAELLGSDFDFIRVDLYYTDDNDIIFGELTPNPGAGKSPFNPKQKDFDFGKLW